MRSSTAVPTRLPGSILVVVLLAGSLFIGPTPAGAAGESDPVGEWPLLPSPDVVRGFEQPRGPWGSGHRGVDLLGHVGQQVRAALGGTVAFAGVLAGRGVVVVDDGSTRTTYEPVNAAVHVGDAVAAGAPLGVLTAARSHCLPRACLHWGWVRDADDVYLDPLRLVGAGPVRLLPLWRASPASVGTTLGLGTTTPYAAWRPPLQLLRLPPGM
jgi:murein DD-endopeptidase MepM/ murein hydrolase activator NlpD